MSSETSRPIYANGLIVSMSKNRHTNDTPKVDQPPNETHSTVDQAMSDPTPTPPSTPPERVSPHRVIVSDTSDDKRPVVRVLEVPARSYDEACSIVDKLENKARPGIPGIGVLPLRLEEALPYFREGFGLRRDTQPRG